MRSVEEYYRARDAAGAPKNYTHDVSLFDTTVQTTVYTTCTIVGRPYGAIANSEIYTVFYIVCCLVIGRTSTSSRASTATSLAWRNGVTSCWCRRSSTCSTTSRPSAMSTRTATPSARVWRSGTCLHNSLKLLLLLKRCRLVFHEQAQWSVHTLRDMVCLPGFRSNHRYVLLVFVLI